VVGVDVLRDFQKPKRNVGESFPPPLTLLCC
jgi:hypothetical protein